MLRAELINRIKRLEIVTRRAVNSLMGGEYHSVFKGQGIQFSEFREYYHGDDVRNIAWKVTAREGHPYITVHEEERELNVVLLVDVSNSNIFASADKRKLDVASELGAMLSFSAIKNNDRVGLLSFAANIEKYIPPKKGRKHVMRVISEILKVQNEDGIKTIVNQGRTSMNKAIQYLNMVLKRRSIVFVISDFIVEEDYINKLKHLSRKHDVVALWVYDKNEFSIPKVGLVTLKDPETGIEVLVDTSDTAFIENYKKGLSDHCNNLRKKLSEAKVDYIPIESSSDYSKALVNYFKHRKKYRR